MLTSILDIKKLEILKNFVKSSEFKTTVLLTNIEQVSYIPVGTYLLKVGINELIDKPMSSQYFISVPPQNVRKPEVS